MAPMKLRALFLTTGFVCVTYGRVLLNQALTSIYSNPNFLTPSVHKSSMLL